MPAIRSVRWWRCSGPASRDRVQRLSASREGHLGGRRIAAPDFSVGVLEFDGGVIARLTNSIVAPVDRSLRVVGERGVATIPRRLGIPRAIASLDHRHAARRADGAQAGEAPVRHLSKSDAGPNVAGSPRQVGATNAGRTSNGFQPRHRAARRPGRAGGAGSHRAEARLTCDGGDARATIRDGQWSSSADADCSRLTRATSAAAGSGLYRPRSAGCRTGAYAARAAAESCSSLVTARAPGPCRSDAPS